MSKSCIAVFFLVFLTSACSRSFTVSTLPTEETQNIQVLASATATPLLNTNNSAPAATRTPSIVTPTQGSDCYAPVSRVAIGQKVLVTVEDWDKLKLRSEPKVSPDNVLMELEQYSQLKILDGPICAHSAETGYSYWFWKVVVVPTGEKGWVAEGDYTHYFLETY